MHIYKKPWQGSHRSLVALIARKGTRFLFLEIRRILGHRWSCDESERQTGTGSSATSSLLLYDL